jgi:uncharacterized protein (UPF0335 family)
MTTRADLRRRLARLERMEKEKAAPAGNVTDAARTVKALAQAVEALARAVADAEARRRG